MASNERGTRPAPLVRTRRNGTPYTRRVEIEAALADLLERPRDEIAAALEIRNPSAPEYIPSECLVHLLRQTRYDNGDLHFRRLYRELMRRIEAAMPRVQGERIGDYENVHAAAARDRIRDAFNIKLAEDQRTPGPGLDYFEVMFADAVATLRTTSSRKAGREASRTIAIERDDDTNEPSVDVERAAGSLDVAEELLSDDPIYRSRVAAAIDALPDKQRRVLELMLQGLPLDSSDENILSIRKVLGVAEKTVRNRRDAALVRIRETLGIGSSNV